MLRRTITSIAKRITTAAFLTIVILLSLPVTAQGSNKTLKFAVLGDVHLGLRGEDFGLKMTKSSERLFELAVRELNQIPDLDFVVFNGDLVVDAESFNLDRFKEIADELNADYFVTIGNHDRPVVPPVASWAKKKRAFNTGVSKATVAAIFSGHGLTIGGPTWWSQDFAGVHIIGLDSAIIKGWGGHISQKQLAWLEQDLAKHRKKPTLIFLHHNLVESYPEYALRENFLVDNRSEVKRLLRKFPGVKAVISSHYHFSDFQKEDGTHYFTTSSINTYPCRYPVFELSRSEIRMKNQLVGATGSAADEMAKLRSFARKQLANADWVPIVRKALKRLGRPDTSEDAVSVLLKIFEANSSVRLQLGDS